MLQHIRSNILFVNSGKTHRCVVNRVVLDTHRQCVYALTIRPFLHVEVLRDVQLQLEVGLHRQRVLTVGILCIRNGPGGTGDVSSVHPRAILGATHLKIRGHCHHHHHLNRQNRPPYRPFSASASSTCSFSLHVLVLPSSLILPPPV